MNKRDMLECLINYYTDGNKAKFASMIGITPQLVSNWLDRSTFNAEVLFAKCKGVSASWLLTGNGEMVHTQNDNTTEEVVTLKQEIVFLKGEIERLREQKLPTTDVKALDVSMKFFEAAKEMFTYYKQMKGE